MEKPLKWVEIDLSAIRHNTRWTLARLKGAARLMAVVKEDAYGHGATAVARAALASGAESLGVLTADEAQVLRQERIRAPIHLLSPILPQAAREAVRLKLTPTLDDLRQAKALNAAAPAAGLGVHIDLDFGLGRWGIAARELPDFLRGLSRCRRLRLAGVSTHIDYVPGKNAVEAEEKLRAFRRLAQRLKRDHPGLVCHAANSAVLMDFPHWQMDLARVGNLIYGINPSTSKTAPLKNPWRFLARVIALRRVIKGRSIGYGSEYVTPRTMRVATLPAGYADGLTMEPAERLISFGSGFQYWGMLGKVKTPFIGRCGIGHVLVDVTDAPGAAVGEAVALPVRRTAASHRIPRFYRN
ncbi:MAG TPA: alanine racemase [Elusimicrobia bacterium]|nr:alanine racemase [Elusimicrobiota bacterium]HBT60954.1 alanine racemase [Elusimicrobiota bacterium]